MTSDAEVLIENEDIAEAAGLVRGLENARKRTLAVCLIAETLDRDGVAQAHEELQSIPELLLGPDTARHQQRAAARTAALVDFLDKLDAVE